MKITIWDKYKYWGSYDAIKVSNELIEVLIKNDSYYYYISNNKEYIYSLYICSENKTFCIIEDSKNTESFIL